MRETWFNPEWEGHRHVVPSSTYYKATDDPEEWTWKSSRFMPRWASRITLEIIAVRVERAQDISETDARAEGVEPIPGAKVMSRERFAAGSQEWRPMTSRDAFNGIWESINGKESWDANPWVWVIEFKRIEKETLCEG